MITRNVIARTFQILFNGETGTCFTIDIDNKQYFVTAKHVLKDAKSGDIISLAYMKNWRPVPIEVIGHSALSDISVFSISSHLDAHPLPATQIGMGYGQDVYFLGFPYGLRTELGPLNNDFPLPMVKKAILSNIIVPDERILLLDGHNNPGFSGGPVVYKHLNSSDFNVAGVISGYKAEEETAYIKNTPSDVKYRTNTGIILAYPIDFAIELIKQNPRGKEIPK